MRAGAVKNDAVIPGWGQDLPDWLNPVLVKELRQNLRRGSFLAPFLAIQLLAIMAVLVEFHQRETGPLWLLIAGVCGVVMPLAGLGAMSQEKEAGNFELLLITRQEAWMVTRGKFWGRWLLTVLVMSSLLPYVIVRYQMGGVELLRDAGSALGVLALSAVLTAGALGASTFRHLAARGSVLLFFCGSCAFCIGISSISFMVHWSVGALGWATVTLGFVLVGLVMVHADLRVGADVGHDRKSVLVVTGIAPILVGITTAATLGFGSFFGMLAVTAMVAAIGKLPSPRSLLPERRARRAPPARPKVPGDDESGKLDLPSD